MIGRLRGLLTLRSPSAVVVDVGGVGYEAAIPLSTFYHLPDEGREVELLVVTNLRENALELFAFASAEERELFNSLRGISGIGPRLALAVLSGIETSDLKGAVGSGDVDRLVSIPGVGLKTAERMLVELKGKLDLEGGAATQRQGEADAVAALVSLGYRRREAEGAVAACRDDGASALEEIIKRSLARLS